MALLLGLALSGACGALAGGEARPVLRAASAADVLREVARPGARAVVLNVWATWCAPCREEFPDLLRVYRELGGQGLRLVLVSADFPDMEHEAREFLARHGVDFPTFIKTGDDGAFVDGIEKSWSGALPLTLVYDGSGALRHFRVGRTTYEELKTKVLEAFRASGAGGKSS